MWVLARHRVFVRARRAREQQARRPRLPSRDARRGSHPEIGQDILDKRPTERTHARFNAHRQIFIRAPNLSPRRLASRSRRVLTFPRARPPAARPRPARARARRHVPRVTHPRARALAHRVARVAAARAVAASPPLARRRSRRARDARDVRLHRPRRERAGDKRAVDAGEDRRVRAGGRALDDAGRARGGWTAERASELAPGDRARRDERARGQGGEGDES